MNQFLSFAKIIRGGRLFILDDNQRFAQTALRPTPILGYAAIQSELYTHRTASL